MIAHISHLKTYTAKKYQNHVLVKIFEKLFAYENKLI